jgi:hypothetical protein
LPAVPAAGGSSDDGAAGNAALIVWPVRGAGCDPGRSAKRWVSAAPAVIGRARWSSAATSASPSFFAGARLP